MYSRKEYLESTDCKKQCLARNNEGLDWNYAIAPKIDRDLHEKLLKIDSSEVLPFIQLLPLISSGYFGTAVEILHGVTAETESLAEVKGWLIASLDEAREV
ncbi:hypothetical protein [Hallerella succinigenes]|uniref:Uncharacterized protein n=1 Tax=Hallerella succinigenes TaxID=1896222 RepID=A0A2M9A9L1_9BACT|nr:hypothetical protein [Hallerella succinigenes]PJJ42399.1 hypothetical protein BGX16_2425 [Hallerella succinigenes]